MFARIGTFSGPPERLDDDVTRQALEQMLRILQSIPGFAGLHVFADRQTGKTISFSLWETEAAAHAWEQMRGPIVAEQVRPTGRSEQESATYELVFSSMGDARFLASATS
jgi:heme-degrading monooxygenase HmoA